MLRLAAGASHLAESFRHRQSEWLAAQWRADGGFAGRHGESDLYYTSFGLRALAILGAISEYQAGKAAAFLQARLTNVMPPVDFFSLVQSAVLIEAAFGIDVYAKAGLDRRGEVVAFVDRLRARDGGYAKCPGSPRTSTYTTFLALACLELVGAPAEAGDRAAMAIVANKRDDGGFVEMAQLQRSGANPTAAAIGALGILGALDEPTRCAAVGFIARLMEGSGGCRANTRIPAADLLSTFTGLASLAEVGSLALLDLDAARRYIQRLGQTGGGFHAAEWDDQADVEFTFYGLGSLAILAAHEL